MNRTQNALKQSKKKSKKNKASVLSVVRSMTFLNEKITAIEVAKNCSLSRQVCSKYLKELREEGLL